MRVVLVSEEVSLSVEARRETQLVVDKLLAKELEQKKSL